MNHYFVIMSILIQIRQQRRVLNILWKSLRNIDKTKIIPKEFLRKLMCIRANAEDTLTNYESFVCQFCIQTAWNSLLKALTIANSFDRTHKVHSRYLSAIIEHMTFGGLKSENMKVIHDCFDCISQLNSLVSLIYKGVISYY